MLFVLNLGHRGRGERHLHEKANSKTCYGEFNRVVWRKSVSVVPIFGFDL